MTKKVKKRVYKDRSNIVTLIERHVIRENHVFFLMSVINFHSKLRTYIMQHYMFKDSHFLILMLNLLIIMV